MAVCVQSMSYFSWKRLCINSFRPACFFDSRTQTRTFSRTSPSYVRNRQEKSLKQAEEEFRTFEIAGLKPKSESKRVLKKKRPVPPPRFQQMPTDQDWTNVWPAATTFKWSVVPLPVRQGLVQTITENDGVTPSKYANAELMKIPNFLHLTPAHVKKHCTALREFCTEWPKGLETDENCRKHFPVEVESSDYIFSGPSIRDPRARTVTVKIHLDDLKLDYHAKDKFLRLVGDRYNKETDEVVFTTDRCPVKKQNFDYAMYLLTAVYHESWKREKWEDEKSEEDMERYFWDISKSRKTLVSLLQTIKSIDKKSSAPEHLKLQYLPDDVSEDSLVAQKEVKQYRDAVSDMLNGSEDEESLQRYGNSVRKLLNIKGNTL
ncbi:28S ribosomal protein S35, mitochondrial-like [Pomacea canaliculata]|uniref:28S ribosomal protein S35, mitochondrial-like n=1 Tax=Pomacea canaliculata TaxID=400727 RepID=UPI000D73E079|nr:28S ribosomal protein S35, mitochondrial-like [Pomacea canaliculata]